MCSVEMTGSKTKRTEELCAVQPLANGEAYCRVEDKDVWHPRWTGKIDAKANAEFIKAVADRIWRDEEVSCRLTE